jgi:hypothetical protein
VNDTIEVEVLEIDGAAPAPPIPEPTPESPPPAWTAWQGRIRQLDARWWPLWVILGILALGLLLTVGVVVGITVLVLRTILRFMAGIRSLFAGPTHDTRLSR